MPGVTGEVLKVLYIGWAHHVHVQRWAEYFASAGHRVWVLPMGRTTPRSFNRVRVLPFFTRERRTSFRTTELKVYGALFKFDLVHVHWAGFGFLPYLAGLTPYVVTAWGSDIYRMHEHDDATQRLICESLRHAALVTVDSADLKRAIETLGVVPERVRVIQWGVDTTLFAPGKRCDRRRAELGIGDGPVIYSPRNIAPIYNTDLILASFQKVLTAHPDAVLLQKHYHCDPEAVASYLKSAEGLGVSERVRLVGDMPYSQVPDLYALADVVVSVPSSDATPMSVLEAMACGVIPVVSDLPSLREWITDGDNGYLVPIRDRDTLAARIIDVLNAGEALNDARRRNRRMIMDRADQGQNMRAMEACYAELVERPRKPA